ncbi:hypothetical protein JCGZ_05620 [Jatropha curcas]|uniref:Homeobox domain-containing protein n=1 Tax=Jatropha curcas TaxID=180498 RepID=A0A067LAA9_JATCU|nr:WUSCHEL-related homeobox 3 [Jatropha curcas]KDP44153.1 hypothetical protein JCGZ_05620 [Jatropha curcas]
MSPSSTTSSSSRWCPTPEQLMILEELYRNGIRTPNASQIQRITAHLSLYGKIEGKNVFYWFQNHKARDRQKLRRKLIKQLQQPQQQLFYPYHDHQLHQNMSNYHHHHHHHLLGSFFDSPPPTATASSSAFLSYHDTAGFLPQGGLEMMNHPWKVEIPQNIQMENSMMRIYGQDWMMMMEGGPPSPTRPLETLELFPITTTNLKEESTGTLSASNNSSEIITFSL